MKRLLSYISIVPILVSFAKCNDSEISELVIEEKAIKITEMLDSSSIKIFHEWNYGQRGDNGYWTKLAGDSSSYACRYFRKQDSAFLEFSRPLNFIRDFPSNYYFDTSRFWQFNFVEYRGEIHRIQTVDKNGLDHIADTLLSVRQIFFQQNPFDTLALLTSLKDSLGVVGIVYTGRIFVEFWLSSRYKLTYLPDNLNMSVASQKYWLEDFVKGKTIKKNWNLRKLY